ncbi:hypothetical protein [uncultured Paludibaculum sp.]|uniref:hypothetical protein n=1 Tax=uncultured Paludibaculum sp. TaxID=1765020 RepID=UPI002AAC451F|nr:hypothetical protein [uncultured Paludibaculum sp.]
MKSAKWLAPAMLAVVALPGWGRWEETRRAAMRGGGDHGKCTIEVEVDQAAEVAVSGDMGVLRTLSGSPAHWRRLECNAPLPTNPYDFRFRGIDGRGDVDLIQQPGRGRPAVVRIVDRKGGREGYTFDLEWRGGDYDNRGRDRGRGFWDGGDRDYDRHNDRNDFSWNNDLRYRGRGDGYFADARGDRNRLYNCDVNIARGGDVYVSFDSDRRGRMALNGRIVRMEGDRVVARMNGGGFSGLMYLETNRRDRVKEIRMDLDGRGELRWRD